MPAWYVGGGGGSVHGLYFEVTLQALQTATAKTAAVYWIYMEVQCLRKEERR